MILVISSPSNSTTGFLTLIFWNPDDIFLNCVKAGPNCADVRALCAARSPCDLAMEVYTLLDSGAHDEFIVEVGREIRVIGVVIAEYFAMTLFGNAENLGRLEEEAALAVDTADAV